jgi:hypothetical protein
MADLHKPFDLEQALRGGTMITRDGMFVDKIARNGSVNYPLTTVLFGERFIWSENGKSNISPSMDLFTPVYRKQPIHFSMSCETDRKHSHYHKDVSKLDTVDIYEVCELFNVNDPSGATQHAIKKLLCGGQRGAKDKLQDMKEARDTIIRRIEMMERE